MPRARSRTTPRWPLGPTCGPELASIGIEDVEDLRALGWEEACIMWSEAYPLRLNVNAFSGVVAAIEGVDWRDLDAGWKARIRALKARLAKESLGGAPPRTRRRRPAR